MRKLHKIDGHSWAKLRIVPFTCRCFCATLRNYANLQMQTCTYSADSPRGSSMFTIRIAETSVKTNAKRNEFP